MVSLTSACVTNKNKIKLRLAEGWALAAERTGDCVREQGDGAFPGMKCPRDTFVLHTHMV